MSENSNIPWPANEERLDMSCRWHTFAYQLKQRYGYLLSFDLAKQIAREAQEHFEGVANED